MTSSLSVFSSCLSGKSWSVHKISMHLLSFLIRLAILLLLGFGLAGCGKPELSRSSTKSLIESSSELKNLTQKLPLNSQAATKARALGILSSKGTLTPKGSKLFSKFNYREASLIQPVSPPSIDVTGIASVPMADDMKEVQFSLVIQYPAAIKRFAVSGGKGVAHFRRYDDGWRLEGVEISLSNDPYPLTAQEQSEEQAEVSAVISERAKLKADLQKLVEESRIPKQEILKFVTGDMFYSIVSVGDIFDIKELILHDTEIYVHLLPGNWGGGGSAHIWFGDFDSIQGTCGIQQIGGRKEILNSYVLMPKTRNGVVFKYLFVNEKNCYEFKKKFEGALKNWRDTYSVAFNSLAELQ